jgi:hypothetical protein
MKTQGFFKYILISVVSFPLVLMGCYHTIEPKAGTAAPAISNAYVIERGRYGDVLKIYLEADDPDNDMLRVATVVDQVGYGRYPVDWVYLKSPYSGHFVGYLQWNTFSSHTGGLREWTSITIKISVFDKAGNESNVVVFPFEFVSEVISNPPPPAPFNQPMIAKLGNVDVNLFEPSRGGNLPRLFDD